VGGSDDDEDEEDSDDEGPTSRTRKRKEKQRQQQQREAEIREREAQAMGEDRAPETVDDFEKVLLSHPDSAFAWIKLMAFHMSLTEFEKARAVAQRAIDTIKSNEEQERLQVWGAWMNLENSYGEEGALDKLVQLAANSADPKAIYGKFLDIRELGDDHKATEQLYKTVTKKFRTSSQMWLRYTLWKLKAGNVEGARNVLQRSLKSIPSRKHIATLSKFAQFEFKYGSAERGSTMFDTLMASAPKRLDLWNVWLDMEESKGTEGGARRLYERVCGMKWSSKKMKALLKRFLIFEKKQANPEGIARVKQLAAEYVEAKTNVE